MLRVLPAARGPEGLQNRRSGGGGGSPPPEGGSRRPSPGGSGGSPSHEGGRSRSTCVTSVCSRGRPLAARSRRGGRRGTSHAGSSAVGLGGSGRPAARTRAPAATSAAAASSAKKIPHWMPTVAAGSWTPGLSNSRPPTSTRAPLPAAGPRGPGPPDQGPRALGRDDGAVAPGQVEGLALRPRPHEEEHGERDEQDRRLYPGEDLERGARVRHRARAPEERHLIPRQQQREGERGGRPTGHAGLRRERAQRPGGRGHRG